MPNFWRVPLPGEQSNPGSPQYIYRFPDARTVFWYNPESQKYPSRPCVYVAQGRFEITSPARTHELYDTKAYYQQLIVPITKRENPSLEIFINVRKTSKAKT